MNAAADNEWMMILFGTTEGIGRDATIEALQKVKSEAYKATNCPKCMGSGRISAFSHIKAGVCFSCGGSGVFTNYRA